MSNQENVIGVNIRLEDDNRTINYMAIGKMVNKKFNGVVYSYEGGGEYSDWYVYQDKYLPTIHKDGECASNDVACQWLDHLVKNSSFTKECYNKMGEYTIFEEAHMVRDEKLIYFENNCFSRNIGIASKIVSSNEDAEHYKWDDDFINLFDWKSLIKDCFMHQVEIDTHEDLTLSELIDNSVNMLMEDLVYGEIFDRTTVENYISTIVHKIGDRGEKIHIYASVLQEYDICTNCGKVLLPNDELYEKHNGDSLCTECAILCEGCNKYFTEDEIYFDKFGVEGCKNCIEKDGQKALKEFDIYAVRTEEYHAKVVGSTKEEAVQLAEEDYSNYDFVEVDSTLNTEIVGTIDEMTNYYDKESNIQYVYQLERYDNWFSRDSLENFGVFTSKEKAIAAIEKEFGSINETEDGFYWNGENQLMSHDMGSFQINKVELNRFGES